MVSCPGVSSQGRKSLGAGGEPSSDRATAKSACVQDTGGLGLHRWRDDLIDAGFGAGDVEATLASLAGPSLDGCAARAARGIGQVRSRQGPAVRSCSQQLSISTWHRGPARPGIQEGVPDGSIDRAGVPFRGASTVGAGGWNVGRLATRIARGTGGERLWEPCRAHGVGGCGEK